ncbi:hypothetical protein [Candidatus Deianiraea vastatrix]|uniref:Signal recognition particle protein n=1 Tax=Candidatus Deianiraea vastatrix TaxID=2163644 RepID=A0A5B8XER1_9RICK|nr:hypothetical protein [Candidatus Deianiraea vastatrix]QED23375.1 Signal recognition particle protein [Candidatus Deianiraea vastatrix]
MAKELFSILFKDFKDKIKQFIKTGANEQVQSEVIDVLSNELVSQGVNTFVVNEIIAQVKKKILACNIKDLICYDEMLKIIKSALSDVMYFILGYKSSDIILDEYSRNDILIIGSHGCGKTLTCVKIANKFSKIGYKVCVASIDDQRDGAQKQLRILTKDTGVKSILLNAENLSPRQMLEMIYKKCEKCDILIIDTFGISCDEDSILKLKNTISGFHFTEQLLVCDSMYGNSSIDLVKKTMEHVDITGVCFTKFDANVNFGSIINIKTASLKPIYYIADGESIDDLSLFNSEKFISRILFDLDVSSYQDDVSNLGMSISTFRELKYLFNTKNTNTNISLAIDKLSNFMTHFELHKPITMSYDRKKEIANLAQIHVKIFEKLIITFESIKNSTSFSKTDISKVESTLLYEDLIVNDFVKV